MLVDSKNDGKRLDFKSATHLPNASSFLWNKSMMIHMNCRGYATAQFMQPEPANLLLLMLLSMKQPVV